MKAESGCKQIFVTGASGWIGKNVCRYLKEHRHQVIACDLDPQAGPWDAFVQCNIGHDDGFPKDVEKVLLPGVDRYLIHCAGYAHRPVETAAEAIRFEQINAEGTRRTLKWADRIGISRFLYISSIAFYDWDQAEPGLPLSEDARLVGRTAYARSKLKGEEYVRNWVQDARVVRLCTVFGDGDPANFSRLARALKRGRFLIPGKGDARKSVVSIDKASEWISRYILLDDPSDRLINLGFQNAPTLQEICEAFHEVCGFRRPLSLSVPLMSGLAAVGDLVARLKPGFPLTRTNVQKLRSSTWVDCRRAAGMFDVDCRFRDSLERAADYYKAL